MPSEKDCLGMARYGKLPKGSYGTQPQQNALQEKKGILGIFFKMFAIDKTKYL